MKISWTKNLRKQPALNALCNSLSLADKKFISTSKDEQSTVSDKMPYIKLTLNLEQ